MSFFSQLIPYNLESQPGIGGWIERVFQPFRGTKNRAAQKPMGDGSGINDALSGLRVEQPSAGSGRLDIELAVSSKRIKLMSDKRIMQRRAVESGRKGRKGKLYYKGDI